MTVRRKLSKFHGNWSETTEQLVLCGIVSGVSWNNILLLDSSTSSIALKSQTKTMLMSHSYGIYTKILRRLQMVTTVLSKRGYRGKIKVWCQGIKHCFLTSVIMLDIKRIHVFTRYVSKVCSFGILKCFQISIFFYLIFCLLS